MKKSELLKLKPGIYLLTDSICNYTYELTKYDKETIVCSIKERGSFSFNSVSLHYDLIKDHDEDYEKWIPRKRLDTLISVGGLSVYKNGGYDILSKLYLIGSYNKDSFRSDMTRFSLNHKINMNRYDRNRFKRPKY